MPKSRNCCLTLLIVAEVNIEATSSCEEDLCCSRCQHLEIPFGCFISDIGLVNSNRVNKTTFTLPATPLHFFLSDIFCDRSLSEETFQCGKRRETKCLRRKPAEGKSEEGRRGRASGGSVYSRPRGGRGYTSVSGGTLAVSLGVNSRVAPAVRASHGLAGDLLPSG